MKFVHTLLSVLSIPVVSFLPAGIINSYVPILNWTKQASITFENTTTTLSLSQTTSDHKHWVWSIAASSPNCGIDASNYANSFSAADLPFGSKIKVILNQDEIDKLRQGEEIACNDLSTIPTGLITSPQDTFMSSMLSNLNSNNRVWNFWHGGGFRCYIDGDHYPKFDQKSVSGLNETIKTSLETIQLRISSISTEAETKFTEMIEDIKANKMFGLLVSYRAYSDSQSRGNSDTRGDEYGDSKDSYAYFYNLIAMKPENLFIKMDINTKKLKLYEKDKPVVTNYFFIVTYPGLTNVGKGGDALAYNHFCYRDSLANFEEYHSQNSNNGSDICAGVGWKEIYWNVNVSSSFGVSNLNWEFQINNPLIQ